MEEKDDMEEKEMERERDGKRKMIWKRKRWKEKDDMEEKEMERGCNGEKENDRKYDEERDERERGYKTLPLQRVGYSPPSTTKRLIWFSHLAILR
jgi:hypothetical protein